MSIDTKQYVFFGRVLPEREGMVSVGPLAIRFPTVNGTDVRISLSIVKCVVQILAQVDASVQLHELKYQVQNICQSFLDLLCFAKGLSHEIEIMSVLTPENEHFVYEIKNKTIYDLAHERIELGTLMSLMQDSFLRHALADLRQAVRNPIDTAFFSYRAIESLMQRFNPDETSKKSWTEFRSKLNIDRKLIDGIKTFADPSRHGCHQVIDIGTRSQILQDTWLIIERYIHYAQNSYAQLSEDEYTMLS